MAAVPTAPFQELLQWPQSFSVCCSIPLRSLYTTVSVSVLAFVCTTPQLALVGCLWLTLVESASITSQIPMKSCTESEGTGELTVPLWGPGCMCVERAVCMSICPLNSPSWSFLSLAAYVLVVNLLSANWILETVL